MRRIGLSTEHYETPQFSECFCDGACGRVDYLYFVDRLTLDKLQSTYPSRAMSRLSGIYARYILEAGT